MGVMTRQQAIAQIQSTLVALPDEQVSALAQIAEALARTGDDEDAATIAAIREGLAQAERGEFATEDEVEAVFARFRRC